MPLAARTRERAGRFVLATQATARLVNWRPTAWSIALGLSLLVTARPPALDLRLAISGALVAASCGFLLDDAAATTLEPTPTTLRTRRAQRVVLGATPLGLWWATAATFVAVRTDGLPLTGRTLQFSALAAIALVGAVLASRHGEQAEGGIAGAVTALLVFAATFLPNRIWLPLPPAPDAPNATLQLTALLAAAAIALWLASRDPAARTRGPVR